SCWSLASCSCSSWHAPSDAAGGGGSARTRSARPPGLPRTRVHPVARVTVVGGGFAGMAVSARLAKLGHQVHLLERSTTLGGALATESLDGFTWDSGPTTTLLPAVVRDLFRKSGRPLEREVDLQPLDLVREHRFEDGTHLRLPGGSRAAQVEAFDGL